MKVKELKRGDRVMLMDGSEATVLTCEPFPLVETCGDKTYGVTFTVDGEESYCLAGGNSEVETPFPNREMR